MSTASKSGSDELTEEIHQTRQQLGDAVQQLAAKADVKRQVTAKTSKWRGTAIKAAKRATAGTGTPRTAIPAAAAVVLAVTACVLLLRWRAGRRA
jgi:Protein of unknown function (DUF3618)